MKRRFSEEQVVGILQEGDRGGKVSDDSPEIRD